MADNQVGGRNADPNGLSLMLGDSHTAANNFGLTGSVFTNVPKSKFLFYVKFYRPDADGLDFTNGLGFAIKQIDRPKVTFKNQTLNQYNRKRVVQTGHEFEPMMMRFHDTVDPRLRNMFVSYYQYYYGDSKLNGASRSVYDVVTGEPFELGKWGFLPPLADQNYGYYFSHISVYQLYGGLVERFDLINPKISTYNPDDFDYSVANISNEIQITIDFESIVYAPVEKIETNSSLLSEMGLDRGQFWDVPEQVVGLSPGSALDPNAVSQGIAANVQQALTRNIASLITGQGTSSLKGFISEVAGAYDANRGLAVGNTALKGVKDLVSGNTNKAKQAGQGLLKGVLFGKPGGLF
jgi:hypothetical protein